MREVVFRRFRRLHDRTSVFPDILLIDGGKGQLNAALDAFRSLGIEPPTRDLAGQAGGGNLPAGRGGADQAEPDSAALRLLQYVRDEAHRFAQHYHHQLRRRRMHDDFKDAE